MESDLRRTWAEVNLDAIAYNYRKIKEKIGKDVKFLGVVKADAYGHGSVQVSKLLAEEGADYLKEHYLGVLYPATCVLQHLVIHSYKINIRLS